MATSTQCRTVTLTDEPEENDAFSGPHQRIADALAGLIQPPEATGISIGVEGSWGSGKSTVARLLTRKLDDDKNIATVSFDAWAHEGDPLRRTFLEAIINELKDRGWTTTDWQKTVDKLARRLEEVTTRDEVSITRWGRVLAFSLLLIPIGGAFITAALREDITLHSGPPAWKFYIFLSIGLLLSFAPFLILLLKIKDESNLLSLFLNKGPTEKTTITNKTANPTSIEFEEQFNKLLEEVLKDNQKRIVLILDNLDRVDAKDALSIWSTLQTFFQHKGTKRALWHERLWLLVLYDLNGLSQLWEDNEKSGGKTAISFIDKSFQVRFEVPALVTSDWRKFLMDQLTRAFPDHSESDLHEVYRVLSTHVALINQRLTIRELKLFVNQIGAIHKQWAAGGDRESDAFPLALIAYYVLLRRTGTNVVNALFNADFPGKAYEELLGDTVRENLAGIAFNVEVDVARQLLFSDKIKNALTLGRGEDLKQVASLLRRGFWEVLEQTARMWASGETVKVAEAALALDESGLLNNAFQPSVRAVTQAFCDRASVVKSWAPLDQRRAAGIAVMLRWKNELQGSTNHNEAFATRLFNAIAEGLRDHVQIYDEGEVAKEWLQCLNLATTGLDSLARQSALTVVIEKVAEQMNSADLDSYRQLCLEVLIELGQIPDIGSTAEKQLREFADGGVIEKALSVNSPRSDRAVAFMLFTSLLYSSDFKGFLKDDGEENPDSFINSSMVTTFVDLLLRYNQIPLLFSSLKAWPRLEPLVAASLRLVLATPDGKDLFTGPDKLERLEFAFRSSRKSPDELATLTKLIGELQTQWDLLSELTAGIFKSDNAGLYLLALRNSSGEQKEFVSWCVAGLRSVSSDIWNYEFDAGGALFSLVFELKSRGAEVHLGEKYHLFLTYVIRSTQEKEVHAFPGQNLVEFVGRLGSASRTLSQRDLEARLRDLLAEALPDWFFSIFGAELTTMILASATKQSVELLEIIFKRTELVALEWLAELVRQHGSDLKIKYASEPAWNKLKNSLRQILTIHVSNPNSYTLMKSIADTLNLKLNLPRNGAIAFAVHGEGRICWTKNGLEPQVLFEESSSSDHIFAQPNWSHDGAKLAYTRFQKSEPKASAIFVFDIVSMTHTMIASGKGLSLPSWSPDGQLLAFIREEGTQQDIYLIDVLTKQQRRLTTDGGEKGRADWSANGRLAFSRGTPEFPRQICVIDSDGSDERILYSGTGAVDPVWSRDGKRILFARWLTDTRSGLYLIDDNSEPVQLIAEKEAHLPVWSPDGEKLLFQTGLREDARIFQLDADGRNQKLLTKGIDPAWQPLLDDGPEETTTSPSEPPS